MATRQLPGAYVSLQDNSQLIEGQTSLTVGYVVKANRGPIGRVELVTSPTDFLTKYTFDGTPKLSDDPTFWSVLKVLAKTNMVYISRAAKDPLYGGATFKKATSASIGTLTSITKATKTFVIAGSTSPAVATTFIIHGTGVDGLDGSYTVKTVSSSSGTVTIVTEEEPVANFTPGAGVTINVYSNPVVPLGTSYATVALAQTALDADAAAAFMILGKDPGAYNGKISYEITSAVDQPNALVYHKNAVIGLNTVCDFDTMQLVVKNSETKETLETFVFSLDPNATTIDGISLYIESVLEGSAYIQVVMKTTPDANFTLPSSTAGAIVGGAGSDGSTVTADDLVTALEPFADKTVNVSILGNGCSTQAESATFQQALLNVANDRKDVICFLNSRATDEAATLGSTRAQNIVTTKKGMTGSTSFYGTMYAPHVKSTDIFNSRQITLGSDAIAIAGWLDVINNLNYPYAYAGPRNGLVTGVTVDWKIGDESGEAQLMNDASVNYVAYDSKVGRYYMQCQNTLQIANSSLRNLGAVFNVLDIKEHFAVSLKEYLQLPITTSLRRDIVNTAVDYLDPMVGTRLYNYAFQDITTDTDIANNTLRYLLTISLSAYAEKIYLFISCVNASYDFSILQSM